MNAKELEVIGISTPSNIACSGRLNEKEGNMPDPLKDKRVKNCPDCKGVCVCNLFKG